MSETVELSEKAKTVCNKHYGSSYKTAKCGECEIRSACIGHTVNTFDSLNRWVKGINDAAAAVEL